LLISTIRDQLQEAPSIAKGIVQFPGAEKLLDVAELFACAAGRSGPLPVTLGLVNCGFGVRG
jgi:hypothetical protein